MRKIAIYLTAVLAMAYMNGYSQVKTKTKTGGKIVKTKTKPAPKPWTYTGTKVEKATVSNQ